MPYVRRQPPAKTDFAWPPTREELDLIEVVEANTLRPVCARCDEPEAARPLPPELLKAVVPVPPVISLVPVADTPRPDPLPAPRDEGRLIASWMGFALRFDPSWLVGAGAATAIALSAYLSLRAAPSVSASDAHTPLVAPTAAEPARPIARLAGAPYAHLELGWPTSIIGLQPTQPSQPTPLYPRRHTSAHSPTLITAARPGRRTPSPAPARLEARLEAHAQPASVQSPVSSVSTLNTRHSPFLSNVIASMPTSRVAYVPISSPPTDTKSHDHPTAVTTAALATRTAAPPSTPSQPQAQQQIYAALHQYERAYAQLDPKAVRAVWPSVDARALERAFRDLKSQRLVLERCDIDVARVQATAACRGRATYETRAGQQSARSEPREWIFTLQKSDEAWRIVSATAR